MFAMKRHWTGPRRQSNCMALPMRMMNHLHSHANMRFVHVDAPVPPPGQPGGLVAARTPQVGHSRQHRDHAVDEAGQQALLPVWAPDSLLQVLSHQHIPLPATAP